ncbi:MAG: hypothetical protein DRP95_01500 [Candidatus Latescibacterota bacterium]|nr:MAG: hypothetical protein DRP95_01500 [Candidatus Latescibacterota bacterium]
MRVEDTIVRFLSRGILDVRLSSEVRGLLEERLDWAYISEKAEEQGVAGLLWRNLKDLEWDGIPVEALRRLKISYFRNFVNYTMYVEGLRPVLGGLSSAGIPVVLLRGPVLVLTVYRDAGLRGFTDVDLWIREEDLPRTEEVLRSAGFSPLEGYPLLFHREGLWIDLHLDLIGTTRVHSRRFGVRIDVDALWEDARPLEIGGFEVSMLSPWDQVLFLCFHAFKHSFWRLIWTVDIAEAVRAYDKLDWNRLVRRAEAFGLNRPTYYGLRCARDLLNAPVPEEVISALKPADQGHIERRLLDVALASLGTDGLSEMLYLFSIPKASQRVRFLWEVVFLRPEVRPQVALRGGFLFYPKRLFRAGALALDIARRAFGRAKRG